MWCKHAIMTELVVVVMWSELSRGGDVMQRIRHSVLHVYQNYTTIKCTSYLSTWLFNCIII